MDCLFDFTACERVEVFITHFVCVFAGRQLERTFRRSFQHLIRGSVVERRQVVAAAAAHYGVPVDWLYHAIEDAVAASPYFSSRKVREVVGGMFDIHGHRGYAWHVAVPDGYYQHVSGFCYLSLIKSEYYDVAVSALHTWPTFYDLVLSPADWFRSPSEVTEFVVITDDETRSFPAVHSLDAYAALACVARSAHAFMGRHLGATKFFSELCVVGNVDVVPTFTDVLGGVDWYVTTKTEGGGVPFADGYCYLMLFKFKQHTRVKTALRRMPSFSAVLGMPAVCASSAKRIKKLLLLSAPVDGMFDAYPAFDALVAAAHLLPELVPESFGEMLVRMSRPRLAFACDPPSSGDRLGKHATTQMGVYRLFRTSKVKYSAPMNVEQAESVLADFMKVNAIPDTVETREQVLTALASVLVGGSTNDRCAASVVTIADKSVALQSFVDTLSAKCSRKNSVRLWARSYANGEMCERISELLKDEENVSMRMVAATEYRVPLRYVHLCFDLVQTYVRVAGVTYKERVVARMSRAFKFSSNGPDIRTMVWMEY